MDCWRLDSEVPLVALCSAHGSVSENPVPSHCVSCAFQHIADVLLFICSLLYVFPVSFNHSVSPWGKKALSTYSWLHPQLPSQCLAYSKCLVNAIHFEGMDGSKKKGRLWGCRMLLLKVGSLNHSIDVFWKLAGNRESHAPPHTYCIRICILTRFPGDSVGTSQFKEHWFTPLNEKSENASQEELPAQEGKARQESPSGIRGVNVVCPLIGSVGLCFFIWKSSMNEAYLPASWEDEMRQWLWYGVQSRFCIIPELTPNGCLSKIWGNDTCSSFKSSNNFDFW